MFTVVTERKISELFVAEIPEAVFSLNGLARKLCQMFGRLLLPGANPA